MKALIIFGSPRKNGDCASLVKTFCENFDGETDIVYAFPNLSANEKGISACINCEACKKIDCAIKDDFLKILKEDYDILLVASPIYMSNLPGPMFNVISRFNCLYHSGKKLTKQKMGALILTGGGHSCTKLQGNSNEDLAIKQAKYIFAKTNSTLLDSNICLCLNTDEIPAKNNPTAQEKIKQIAQNLSTLKTDF